MASSFVLAVALVRRASGAASLIPAHVSLIATVGDHDRRLARRHVADRADRSPRRCGVLPAGAARPGRAGRHVRRECGDLAPVGRSRGRRSSAGRRAARSCMARCSAPAFCSWASSQRAVAAAVVVAGERRRRAGARSRASGVDDRRRAGARGGPAHAGRRRRRAAHDDQRAAAARAQGDDADGDGRAPPAVPRLRARRAGRRRLRRRLPRRGARPRRRPARTTTTVRAARFAVRLRGPDRTRRAPPTPCWRPRVRSAAVPFLVVNGDNLYPADALARPRRSRGLRAGWRSSARPLVERGSFPAESRRAASRCVRADDAGWLRRHRREARTRWLWPPRDRERWSA